MKKLVTSLFFAVLLICTSFVSGKNYLIQSGAAGAATWTKTISENDSVVDLTVAGKTITAWLAGRASWAAGDQIWILVGEYSFTSYYNIGSSPSLATSYPSAIYGGFAGNENAIADRQKRNNAWDYTHETILNGSTSTNGIFGAGGDRTMIIDGLTFTGCINTAGQAVWQRPNMTIRNCKFTNNACVSLRYYISAASKTASVSNCYFSNNTNTVTGGAEGGCIMANNSSAGGTYTITDCVFESNSCTASGSGASAGVKAQGVGNVEINKCVFRNNNATAGSSSAVSLTSATSTIKNSLIYGTSVATNKVAVYVSAGSVINCTVVNNLGGGAYLSNAASSTISLINNVFWGEDVKSGQISAVANCLGNITNCAYNSLSANFIGNIVNTVDITTTTTGLFTDPANNLWTLASGSVLIDMGTATNAPATDLTGVSRPYGSGVDIGAYEFLVSANSQLRAQKKAFIQYGNKLVAEASGKAYVYDVYGKLRISKIVQTGDEIVLESGVYFITLNTSEDRIAQKIML
jgi:hypothetical protein